MVIYFPNYARLKKLRDANKKLILENAAIIEEIQDYEDKLKMVGEDPYLYEKIAREELGIARDGEIVIDIEE
ncbi:MAG: septum formation initiator family protein [Candidatus Omnitrophica bacterium]|nr:septum formation initiator family protein [Candidatus Omnitrophota bacterium]